MQEKLHNFHLPLPQDLFSTFVCTDPMTKTLAIYDWFFLHTIYTICIYGLWTLHGMQTKIEKTG